jgi:hypothetical protein
MNLTNEVFGFYICGAEAVVRDRDEVEFVGGEALSQGFALDMPAAYRNAGDRMQETEWSRRSGDAGF